MTTNSAAYTLPDTTWLLHDGDNNAQLEIEALVASGDCLVTLATNLDEASELLPATDASRLKIEKVTRTLLYLQRRYKLAHKTPEHRQ